MVPPHLVGVDTPEDLNDPNIDRPVVEDESSMTEDAKNWWLWFKGQLDDFKGWVSDLSHGHGKNGTQTQ